ncbi:MAG TPA: hypothetical protein VE914_06465 [Candidatus Angelobacter sp.]|nr:hypothetical protein [Candidatus Angelobacter sp.]
MARPKFLTFFCDTRRLLRRASTPTANVISGLLIAGLGTAAVAPGALAATFCAQTADAALAACQNDVNVTFFTSKGICINETDDKDRATCNADAQTEKTDGLQRCKDQKQERLRVCAIVGDGRGGRYDPEFEPSQFANPDRIGDNVKPNPYFPLVRGTVFTYQEKMPNGRPSGQVTTDTVTNKTKLIDGITCRVVEDVVKKNGVVIELTDDWFAQDLAGNVWYCGELARVFETFKGDRPQDPELTTIDGSFKAERNGDKPGIIALAAPSVHDAYYEEFSLENAEDAAEVTSLTGSAAVPAAMCDKTCLVTRNTSSIDLDLETKYYAPGVGLILEVDPDGTRNELIKVSH